MSYEYYPYPDEVFDMDVADLERQIIGKTIIEIDKQENKLTLNDGTILHFKDTHDCCAWFSANLTNGNLTDNAITALKVTDRQEEEYDDEDYTIHILAANKNIVDLDITGNPTSGYYCHSITLDIYTPKES